MSPIRQEKEKDRNQDEGDAQAPLSRLGQREEAAVAFLVGTYSPRSEARGNLRQYTVLSEGCFLDYFRGSGSISTEVIGAGFGGHAIFERRRAPISPFLSFGWGVYHARDKGTETKLAWRVGLGLTTRVGAVAQLQILDTRLRKGDLRGSSLLFGWRF